MMKIKNGWYLAAVIVVMLLLIFFSLPKNPGRTPYVLQVTPSPEDISRQKHERETTVRMIAVALAAGRMSSDKPIPKDAAAIATQAMEDKIAVQRCYQMAELFQVEYERRAAQIK